MAKAEIKQGRARLSPSRSSIRLGGSLALPLVNKVTD